MHLTENSSEKVVFSNDINDLRNEHSSDIDETEIDTNNEEKSTVNDRVGDFNGNFDYINLDGLEMIDTYNDIPVNKKNIRKNDKEKMINYKNNTIEENSIDNCKHN